MPTIRVVAVALAILLPVCSAHAQTPPTPARPAAAAPTVAAPTAVIAVPDRDARSTREELRALLERLPPDVGRILKMDPMLMRTDAYLQQYPPLAAFLASHPEVAHNAAFYFEFVQAPSDWEPLDARSQSVRMYRDLIEGVAFFSVFVAVSGFIAWFVRTFIDYRRWLRLSRVQTEVHNKLLDRFAGSGDLLAYVQSPAGRRFLESAPIPLDAGPRHVAAPFGRILWAVQAGIVIGVVGLGFKYVSRTVIDEIGGPLGVVGALAIALGIGFIVSGVASYFMARRLGLMTPPSQLERAESPSSLA